MKKFVSVISVCIVVFSLATCHKEKVDSTLQKYDISQSVDDLNTFIDYPVSFSLKSSGFSDDAEKECTVTFGTDITGSLVVGKDTMSSGTSFKHDFNSNRDLALKYIPHKAGTHQVVLTFNNGYYEKTTTLNIITKDFYFDVSFTDIPERFIIDKKHSFKMTVAEKTASDMKQFNISAAIVRGGGEISVSDVVISGEGQKSKVNIGDNVVSFLSANEGTNTVEFLIETPSGYVDKISKSFDVILPSFAATVNQSSTEANVSLPFNFLLHIDDSDNSVNEYSVAYRFVQGSGTLKINSEEAETGKTVSLRRNDNVMVYTATEKGIVEIEFLVSDKYGQQKKTTTSFEVKEESTTLNARQAETRIKINQSTLINLDIQRKGGFSGKYNIMYTIEKGSGTLIHGETNLTQGVWSGSLSTVDAVYFKPSSIGEAKITLKVKDEQDISTSNSVTLVYTVVAANFEVVPVSVPAIVEKDVASLLNYRIQADEQDSYTILFTQTSGTGQVNVNNMPITSGGSISLSSNIISFDYLATSIGQHVMNLRFTNTSGVVRDVPITLTARYKDISFSVASISEQGLMIEKEESAFKYRIDASESETFTVKYTQTTGSGTLKINNVAVPINSAITVSGTSINLDCIYTPAAPGNQNIVLVVTNQAGTAKNIYIAGNARVRDVPFSLSATGSIPTNILVDQEAYFEYKIVSDYSDQFKVRYNLLAGSGAMSINNILVTNSSTVSLSDKNMNFKFVPSTKGTHNVEFYVSNSVGTEKKISITFVANYADIPFTVSSSLSGGWTEGLEGQGRVHLTIASQNPDEYTVKHVYSVNNGILNYNSQSLGQNQSIAGVSSGTHEFTYLPKVHAACFHAATSQYQFHLEVTNRAGTTKRVTVNINAKSIFYIRTIYEDLKSSPYIYELKCTNERPDDLYEIIIEPFNYYYYISIDEEDFHTSSGKRLQDKILSNPTIWISSNNTPMNLQHVYIHNITMGWRKRLGN